MINGKTAIYLAILNQGEVRAEISQWVNSVIAEGKFTIFVDYPESKPISFNRNKIVKKFLTTECDYLMMLDSDIVPPANILDLSLFGKDIIGGLCFSFSQIVPGQAAVVPLILKRNKKILKGDRHIKYSPLPQEKWEGLTECDAIGTGCIIIARHVLENPFWLTHYGHFPNIYDKTGDKVIGLDINFCYRAKKLGYKTYCHTDFKCSHWTPMNLLMIHNSFTQLGEIIERLKTQAKK